MTSKFALITGGTRGLGKHLVEQFWLAGYSLGIIARKKPDIQSVIDGLPDRGTQTAKGLACDLASVAEVQSLLEVVKTAFPYLNVLVNNAALQGPIGPLEKNNLAAWQRTLQVNLIAPVALCQAVIPLMKKSNSASIINISGGGATGPRANFSAYATAKSGLVRFSETLAEELKGDSIRVNCIAPGPMRTEMLREVMDHLEDAGDKEVGLASGVFEGGGAPMTLASSLALFLAGDSGSCISGKLISAVWDNWQEWPQHVTELSKSDVYTLRRITGRDRGFEWGDR